MAKIEDRLTNFDSKNRLIEDPRAEFLKEQTLGFFVGNLMASLSDKSLPIPESSNLRPRPTDKKKSPTWDNYLEFSGPTGNGQDWAARRASFFGKPQAITIWREANGEGIFLKPYASFEPELSKATARSGSMSRKYGHAKPGLDEELATADTVKREIFKAIEEKISMEEKLEHKRAEH